ncbi:MAG: glycosyltransferase [Bacteroidetes bacterium]|nr:MAG: glycosyltransferase [Bacteroidota bacterium]
MTYNHENYIRDCIEGILMQKTTFPVQVLIHDDASTDRTAEIVREYEVKFPRLIKAYYQEENTYSDKEKKKKLREPFRKWRIGKYEAICEGDDYWIDPYKLEKQVDFLEENDEYVLSFHKAEVISETNKEVQIYDHLVEGEYTARAIYEKWSIPTCSVVYRQKLDKMVSPVPIVFGDLFRFLSLLEKGKGYCHGFTGSVYRRHSMGVTNNLTTALSKKIYFQYKYFEKRFPQYKDISRATAIRYLDKITSDKTDDELWKFRFYKIWHVKKLFFRPYFIKTLFIMCKQLISRN